MKPMLTRTVGRTLAAVALAAALASAGGYASATEHSPVRATAVQNPSDDDCPPDTFCARDDQGHYAHYRAGADDVRAQGLHNGAVWGWNRTQASWCAYSQPNGRGDDSKFRSNESKGVHFYSVKPSRFGICSGI
ncbi:hypothetical protein [Streptomyces orinoci]|uniref:Peptidase inhibitor family I36 n=1 Tax=Streptomyces orinoci TaxID=67339 RepID=A0ABV3JZT6_STRON|nr:hypothetical protein [Streptomyces orinoci]